MSPGEYGQNEGSLNLLAMARKNVNHHHAAHGNTHHHDEWTIAPPRMDGLPNKKWVWPRPCVLI